VDLSKYWKEQEQACTLKLELTPHNIHVVTRAPCGSSNSSLNGLDSISHSYKVELKRIIWDGLNIDYLTDNERK
jgi:hypothetical protein